MACWFHNSTLSIQLIFFEKLILHFLASFFSPTFAHVSSSHLMLPDY